MASKVKEKPQQLLQKYELKCRELIGNFKKSIAVWILYRAYDETTFQEIQNSCVEIVLDGLKYEKVNYEDIGNVINFRRLFPKVKVVSFCLYNAMILCGTINILECVNACEW